MDNKGRIYWITGQRGVGKTVLATKLKEFLQTEKRNWRKDVFLIDYSNSSQLDEAHIISNFLLKNDCDVVVSLSDNCKQKRDEFKSLVGDGIIEIYLYSNRKKLKDLPKVDGYEPPTENYYEVDTTTDNSTQSFSKLINYLKSIDKI
jgi:adenylylsulfate kinase-like enzyme